MIFGIICEFNPFHNGHAYLFEQAKLLGATGTVCVMSGNAVQRGELAITDKYLRAEASIKCGADLVLELPFPWSSASAEYFASAGIKIAADYCDAIIFGSETGDIELLSRAAELALSNSFIEKFEEKKKSGEGAATAYFSLLNDALGTQLSSNDLLGVEYIKAAKRNNIDIAFFTVKRKGNAYLDSTLRNNEFPSASALRNAWKIDKNALKGYMPKEAEEVFVKASSEGALIDEEALGKAYMMFFRLCEGEEISQYTECEGGIANRISSLAKECSNYNEFFEKLKTKRYTDAKLRRALLFALCRVKSELLAQTPQYTYLLGADGKGREILSGVKKNGKEKNVKVITKPADSPKNTEQHCVEERLNSIFTLFKALPESQSEEYRKNAYIK